MYVWPNKYSFTYVVALDSKLSNGFCPVARYTKILFFGQDFFSFFLFTSTVQSILALKILSMFLWRGAVI